MKIQSLAVIFIIIILPISMILTAYTSNQIKTLNLQTSYDSNLDNATYDALKAFQLNTINNSTSDLSNSKIRDIEASVNTFFNSIASNFNMVGYNQDVLKEYVPALVYTMYDGYYIYSPFINTLSNEDATKGGSEFPNDTKITGLKPYIHYSMRYEAPGIDVVITYSLDNYITIQGTVNGNGINDSGYVIDNISNIVKDSNGNAISVKYRGITIEGEAPLQEYIGDNSNTNNLYNYIKINGVKYYKYKPEIDGKSGWFTIINGQRYGGQPNLTDGTNYSAVQYYADAYEFGQRLESYGIKDLKTSDVQIEEISKKDEKFGNVSIFSGGSDSVEEPNSNFNQHRLAVIRYSIEKNLSIAIANYNNYQGQGKANFAMPELKEDEWDKILNNISIISFLQGLNIGGKIYNGYSIITNTKNKEVVAEDSIYVTTTDGEYHNINEIGLNEKSLGLGVLNIDFERVSKLREDGQIEYYYPKTQLGSYNSVVTQTNVADTDNIYDYLEDKPNLAKAYYTALGRERNGTYKAIVNSEGKINSLTHEEVVPQTYQIKINYIDEDRNYISSSITTQQEGYIYNITAPIIPNYVHETTEGNTSGELHSDIEINFIYRRIKNNYQIKINYLDEEGNEIKSPDIATEEEGYLYNIVPENKIDKYTYVRAEGSISGELHSNIEINLIYKINTYQIKINYLDENGNTIKDSTIMTEAEGHVYNIVPEEIINTKYKIVRAEGNTSGELHSDIKIKFIYRMLNTYNVTITYKDINTGRTLYVQNNSGLEGTSYDFTESYKIDSILSGYDYIRGEGSEFLSGTYSSNRQIIVYCIDKILNPDIEITHNNYTYNGHNFTVLSESPNKGGVDGNGNTCMTISATFMLRGYAQYPEVEQLIVSTCENSGWALRIDENRRINFELHDGNTWRQQCVINQRVQLNQRYNVIATYDGNEIKMYLNGSLAARYSLPGVTITQLPGVRTVISGNPINNSNSVSGGYFNGRVYDVKIYYGDVLNENQIRTIYNRQRSEYGF